MSAPFGLIILKAAGLKERLIKTAFRFLLTSVRSVFLTDKYVYVLSESHWRYVQKRSVRYSYSNTTKLGLYSQITVNILNIKFHENPLSRS